MGIVGSDGALDRGPRRERLVPGAELGPIGEEVGQAERVEGVEVAVYRALDRVDEMEARSGEIGTGAQMPLKPFELAAKLRPPLGDARFAVGAVEAGDVAQDGRAIRDPGAVLGALRGSSGWRRGAKVSSRKSQMTALSNRTASPTSSKGTLPSGGETRWNQSGLADRLTVRRGCGTDFSASTIAARWT